jgi:ribose-phosphate pyrophosphokinase
MIVLRISSLTIFKKEVKMQILNLSKGFEPLGPASIVDASRAFPSRVESNIELIGITPDIPVTIVTRFDNAGCDVMKLLLATDALRRNGIKEISLFLPFLPYARQDRLEPEWLGQSFALKVFADLLNTQNYAKVTSFDVHSQSASAMVNNFFSHNNHDFGKKVLGVKQDYAIVVPDAGAAKKIRSVAKFINYKERPVQVLKYRSIQGQVDEVELPAGLDLGGRDTVIIDDILDGAGTFISVAKELKKKNAGNIYLIVSHFIGCKGVESMMAAGIECIYTTDSFPIIYPDSYKYTDYVKVTKLSEIILQTTQLS